MMSLLLNVFAIIGGLVSAYALYTGAKERGAKDQELKTLSSRVDKMETRQDTFERDIMKHVVDIKEGIATVNGKLSISS